MAGSAQDEKYFIGSPTVAIEILSSGEDWAEKLDLYIADGAKEVWIIDHRSEAAGFTVGLPDVFGTA